MSTKTEQELHVAAELELFEKQGKQFRCKGSQEQDLAKVVQKIEGAIRGANRSAERYERQGVAAEATANADEAARLRESADAQRRTAKQLDTLAKVVLDAAAKLKPHVKGDVGTEHVVSFLLRAGADAHAAALNKHARVGCGQDLRPTIAALPRPCESEPYVCPKCGREGHASKPEVAEVEA